jgi:hypothetical protein
MSRLVKIENDHALSKDIESGAIINIDKTGYQSYIDMRNKKLQEDARLDNLENELSEIKSLLLKLLQNN